MLGIPIPEEPPVTTAMGLSFSLFDSRLIKDASFLVLLRDSRTSSAVDFFPSVKLEEDVCFDDLDATPKAKERAGLTEM